jgi:hypothetical protein
MLISIIYVYYRKNNSFLIKGTLILASFPLLLYTSQNFGRVLESANKGWVLSTMESSSSYSIIGVGHSLMVDMQNDYSLTSKLNGIVLLFTVYGLIGGIIILLHHFILFKSIYSKSNRLIELSIIIMFFFFIKMSFQFSDFYNLLIFAHLYVLNQKKTWINSTISTH